MEKSKKKNYNWIDIENYINEGHYFEKYAKTLPFDKKSYFTAAGWGSWDNFWYDKQPVQFLKDGKYLIEAIYSYCKWDDRSSPPSYPIIGSKEKKVILLSEKWNYDSRDYYFDVEETSFNIYDKHNIKNIKEQKNAHNTEFEIKNDILYYNNSPMFDLIKDKYAIYSGHLEVAARKTHQHCSGSGDNKSCSTEFDNRFFNYHLNKKIGFIIDNDNLLVNDRTDLVASNGYYGGFIPYDIGNFRIPYISPTLIGVEVKSGIAKIIKLKDYGVNNIDYIFNTDLGIDNQKISYNIDEISATLLMNEVHKNYSISENPIVNVQNNTVDLTFAKQIYSYDGFAGYNDWVDMLLMQLCVYKLD